MFKLFKNRENVVCPFSVLRQILENDLEIAAVEEINFTFKGKKHSIGIDGEYPQTKKMRDDWKVIPSSISFFFDDAFFDTLENMYSNALLEGIPLSSCTGDITVTECSWEYPRCNVILDGYFNNYPQGK